MSADTRGFDVARHPLERPLFLAVVIVSTLVWLLLAISVAGLIYAFLFAAFFFVSHLVFVAYVRGSAVKLGPDQFPDLHGRVVELAAAMKMRAPETYVMQAGGALNAFATRFLRRDLVILYSDLLEACEENDGARDMILAHELGHLKCNHLRWLWYTLPGHFFPFLGSALSRAREYTCDRYGAAGAGDAGDAAFGLTILAAGPRLAPEVNRAEFVRQREDMNTGLMTLGQWFASHPPLSRRIAAIDGSLRARDRGSIRGPVRALAILAVIGLLGLAGTVVAVRVGSDLMGQIESLADADDPAAVPLVPESDVAAARRQVEADFADISSFLEESWVAADAPIEIFEIREVWEERYPDRAFPTDPFDGFQYGYTRVGASYELLSSGPDGEPGTEDDITQVGEFPR